MNHLKETILLVSLFLMNAAGFLVMFIDKQKARRRFGADCGWAAAWGNLRSVHVLLPHKGRTCRHRTNAKMKNALLSDIGFTILEGCCRWHGCRSGCFTS